MAGPNPAAGIDIVQEFLPKPVSDFFVAPQGADPRVAEWFLLDSPVLPAVIGALYLLSIPVGKWFMRDREPVNVRSFATVHNAFLAGLSLYMVVETLLAVYDDFNWSERFTLWCNGVNRTGIEQNAWTKSGYRLASVLYVHYVSKAYEFVDTWLMIAKKNHRQISFLHVYHHSTTFFPVWYWNVTYAPGGDAWFCCFLNSLVHVFMYSHYLISGLGYKSPIRKFITLFQLIQFVLFISQSVYLLTSDCFHPRLPYLQLGFQCVIFFGLFLNFYIQAYRKPRSSRSRGGDAHKGDKSSAANGNGNANGHNLNNNKKKPE